MLERLSLRNDRLLAEIVPQAGGALARLDWIGGASPTALLRALPAEVQEVPLPSQLACFPLVPWSNRMAPTGFTFDGRQHVPAPNRAGEPCPIHGDGWQQAWQVVSHNSESILVRLERHDMSPFTYDAGLRYTLEGDALVVELTVRNAGTFDLPFGLGLHPWLPDPAGARLQAKATQVWLSGPDKLPSVHSLLPSHWNFSSASLLPQDGVDNVFEGWDGVARISWPARGVQLAVEADMAYFILYAPPGRDFFCFEPVDHPINAHNMSAYPGLTVLASGASLQRRVVFRGAAL